MDNAYEKHSTEDIRTFGSSNDGNAKVCGKRKRNPGTPSRRHQRPEDVPWTAARCNRLLRTITSRIQILRRLSENNFADKAAARQSPARRKIIFKPEINAEGRISPECIEDVRSQLAALPTLESPTKDGTDPDWLPDGGPKPSRRTYGGKGNKTRKVNIEEPSRPNGSSSIGDFRSTFIKRILRTEAAYSPINHVTETPRRLTSQKIVLDPKTHAERALRTLLDSFSTVLSTTAHTPPSRGMGVASLRSMCLRKVPDYIDYEQQDAYDEEEYDFDATESIYLHLEERLGTGPWSGLRTVARAHAVKMIADATDERSWPVESLDRLLDVCERNQAIEEGQQILRSWFMKAEGRGLNRVVKVLAWSKILDCTGFFFKTLRDMLESGCGHVHELFECPGVWQDLLKALARKSTRTDAAEFLEAYVYACLQFDTHGSNGVEGVRLHQRLKRDEVLHNIMVLVTALCWTIDDPSPALTNVATTLTSHVHRMAINVCRNQRTPVSRSLHRSIEPLLISSIVLHALHTNGGFDQPQLLPPGMNSQTIVSHILSMVQFPQPQGDRTSRTEFVCSTAKCIAHASQSSANSFIYDLSTSLLLLANRVPEQCATLLKLFAVNTAAAWAEYRVDQTSSVFADEVERAAFRESPGKLGHTPGSAQKPKIFRFEEAIGEWIATTPLAGAKIDAESWNESRGKLDRTHELTLEARTPSEESDRTTLSHTKVHRMYSEVPEEDDETEDLPVPVYSSSSSSQSSLSPSSEMRVKHLIRGVRAESVAMAREELTTLAIPSKSTSTDSVEQELESPLQAKIFRCISDRPQQHDISEQDELAATPYKKEPIENVTAPATSALPAAAFGDPSSQITLALRPRPFPTPPIESGALLERDELAVTPTQHLFYSPELERPISAPQSICEAHDELNNTPVKLPVQPTRVLRSARQKTALPVQIYTAVQPRDELAMTPAQRVRVTPRKTKVAKQQTSVVTHLTGSGERDELGVTPLPSRSLRSRPKQASTVKDGSRLRTTKMNAKIRSLSPSETTEKQKKLPLGARSANIRTVAKSGTKTASDDELGL